MGDYDCDPYGVAVAVMLSSAVEAEWPWFARPDSNDTAPGLEADNARRAADLAHHVALGVVVIRGDATDQQIAEYAALQDASWARDIHLLTQDVRRIPTSGIYDADHARPSPSDGITRAAFDAMDGAS